MSSKFTIAVAILATSFLYEQYGERNIFKRSPEPAYKRRGRNNYNGGGSDSSDSEGDDYEGQFHPCEKCDGCPKWPINLIENYSFEDNEIVNGRDNIEGTRPDPGCIGTGCFADRETIFPWKTFDTATGLETFVEICNKLPGEETKHWNVVHGQRGLELNPDRPIEIKQTINGIKKGKKYKLSFWLSGNRCANSKVQPPRFNPRIKTGYVKLQDQSFEFVYDIDLFPTGNALFVEHTFKNLEAVESTLTIGSTTLGRYIFDNGLNLRTACGPVIDKIMLTTKPDCRKKKNKYGKKKNKYGKRKNKYGKKKKNGYGSGSSSSEEGDGSSSSSEGGYGGSSSSSEEGYGGSSSSGEDGPNELELLDEIDGVELDEDYGSFAKKA